MIDMNKAALDDLNVLAISIQFTECGVPLRSWNWVAMELRKTFIFIITVSRVALIITISTEGFSSLLITSTVRRYMIVVEHAFWFNYTNIYQPNNLILILAHVWYFIGLFLFWKSSAAINQSIIVQKKLFIALPRSCWIVFVFRFTFIHKKPHLC